MTKCMFINLVRGSLMYSKYCFISLEILVYKAFKSEHTVCLLFYLLRCIAHNVLLHRIRSKRKDKIDWVSEWVHEIEERKRESFTALLFLNYDTNATYIFNLKWIKCIKINSFHSHFCFSASHKYSALEIYTCRTCEAHSISFTWFKTNKRTNNFPLLHGLRVGNCNGSDDDNERWQKFQKPLHFQLIIEHLHVPANEFVFVQKIWNKIEKKETTHTHTEWKKSRHPNFVRKIIETLEKYEKNNNSLFRMFVTANWLTEFHLGL